VALNVVLVEPEIPQNTGNIARTCVVTNSTLHIIKPMGFSLEEKHIRRAGLDYWKDLKLITYDTIDELWQNYPDGVFLYFTTKAKKRFDTAAYPNECFLVFGKETAGLSRRILEHNRERCVRIPMYGDQRCLNLSNAVSVAVYEALRANEYFDLN
jgi:tRNA (cytidine/uridine-2'-O-)-methyltransferase